VKCYICDKQLTELEIQYNPLYQGFDPCSECLEIIGEVFGEEGDEEEISDAPEDEHEPIDEEFNDYKQLSFFT